MYLKSFRLVDSDGEFNIKRCMKSIYNTTYPLNIFTMKEFCDINFNNVTIFYGGNGSGKSTILNIISKKIGSSRKNILDLGELFDTYVECTSYDLDKRGLKETKFISSDDVFDYLLDTRAINNKVNRRKEELGEEYLNRKYIRKEEKRDVFLEYEQLKEELDASRNTVSIYTRNRLSNNTISSLSNGETALVFWEREINDHGIYILDEPENSLSAENQLKLRDFILDSARFYNCQFIISTHSPFLLSIKDALIYDLDTIPVVTKKWTELNNVRVYYDFFKENDKEFTL